MTWRSTQSGLLLCTRLAVYLKIHKTMRIFFKNHFVLFLALALNVFVSCGTKSSNRSVVPMESTAVGAGQETDLSQASVLSIDELLASAGENIGKEVKFRGICTHTCKHGAKKMFLMGSDGSKSLRVESGELGSFDTRCINNMVEVTGILEEERIDEAYLQRWENSLEKQTVPHHGDGKSGCEADKKARAETGNTESERIASFRERIAERNEKEGKNYLSFYYVTAKSYRIEE